MWAGDAVSTKKREILQRNPVTVSPVEVVVEAGNWEGSSLFTVHNSADAVLYQIRVKITVDHPHIRIQDFTIESPNPTGESAAAVGQIGISRDFIVLPGRGSEVKKAKYIVIRRLSPSDSQQFIVTKRSPYVPTRHYALYANIVGFDRELAPK